MQIFGIFECSGQNLSNSLCQFWTGRWITIQILYYSSLSWHKTPLQILSSHIFSFRQNYAIKVPIWRLSSALVKICKIPHDNSWKHKPVFIQTLYRSWMKSHKTPPFLFLAETLYTFSKSSRSKYKFGAGEISPEQPRAWNFALWWAPFVKIKCSFS